MAAFFSVQSSEDARRLAAGGDPWPAGLQRANMGKGFYCWDSREVAERYRGVLLGHGVTDLQIVAYEIDHDDLGQLRKMDLTLLDDDALDTWMLTYSHYGHALPNDWEYVIRSTD